jgi:hypothetical protein
MFIRLKKPTFVLIGSESAVALPNEVLFNLDRIGTVSFGTTANKVNFADGQKLYGAYDAGLPTIQINLDASLRELAQGIAEPPTRLVFPQQLHGEYERIRRILEAQLIE